MKQLLSLTRAAVDKYNMIDEGDRIAVGVSGGKDSLALLYALARLREFYPKKFEVVAITLDYRFNFEDGDFSRVQTLCDELGVEYIVKKTDLYKVIFVDRKEKIPARFALKCAGEYCTIQLKRQDAIKLLSDIIWTMRHRPL